MLPYMLNDTDKFTFQKKFKLNLNLILNQNGVPCNYPINRDSLDIYNIYKFIVFSPP